jgi:hypothetical protein
MRVEAVRSGSSSFAAGAFFASFTESVEFWQDLIKITAIIEQAHKDRMDFIRKGSAELHAASSPKLKPQSRPLN